MANRKAVARKRRRLEGRVKARGRQEAEERREQKSPESQKGATPRQKDWRAVA